MRTTAGTIGIAATVLIVSFLLPENRPHVPAPAYIRAEEGAAAPQPESPRPPAASAAVPVFPQQESQADRAIQKRLDTTIPPLHMPEDVIFEEAVEALKAAGDIPVSVNWNVLNVVGIDRETPILGLTFENVKLGTALELLLDNVGGATGVELDYEVIDGMVHISTQEDLNRRTEVRVYDCRDLIDPWLSKSQRELIELIAREYVKSMASTSAPAGFGGGMGGHGGYGRGGYGRYYGGGGDDAHEDADLAQSDLDRFVRSVFFALQERRAERAKEFVYLIQNHVTPGLWEPEGLVASVSEYDGLLVIGHTKSGHRQVLELLAMLRQAQAARGDGGRSDATASGRVP